MNLHVYPSNISNESRIEKIAESLLKNNIFSEIVIAGKSDKNKNFLLSSGAMVVVFRGLFESRNLIFRVVDFLVWYFRILRASSGWRLECVNAHSLSVLPLCVLIKTLKGCKLIYDTHELETETNSTSGIRKLVGKLIEKYLIKYADKTVVVSGSYADWYERAYDIERPVVVRNVPKYVPPYKGADLRSELGFGENDRVFLYQGLITEGRGIRALLCCFQSLVDSNCHLLVMGYGPLKPLVEERSLICPNIHLLAPVPPDVVLKYTAVADYGLCFIEATSLSYKFSLPNKLFEYCMAGKPVIAFDLPEIANVISEGKCGYVIPEGDMVEMKLAIILASKMGKDYRNMVTSAKRVASQYCWEAQEAVLIGLYQSLSEGRVK